MIQLNEGTVEVIPVLISDATGVTTTLVGSTPTFTVTSYDPDTGDETSTGITDESADVSVMQLLCLFDSTVGPLTSGRYRLRVKFVVGSETPIVGPFDILLSGV